MGREPTSTFFSHVKPGDTRFEPGGLRDFFLYRDLGIAGATNGKMIAHLVKANLPPADGTGWHYHVCDFQIVIMMKGWAKFMYEDKGTLVEAGDVVHQRPGMAHYLFDYSPDMEYLGSSRRPTSARWTGRRHRYGPIHYALEIAPRACVSSPRPSAHAR